MTDSVTSDLKLLTELAKNCAVFGDEVQIIAPLRCMMVKPDLLLALVECAEALKVVAPALNTARLIMDKESRDYVGELLNTAGAALAKLEAL